MLLFLISYAQFYSIHQQYEFKIFSNTTLTTDADGGMWTYYIARFSLSEGFVLAEGNPQWGVVIISSLNALKTTFKPYVISTWALRTLTFE